LSRSNHEDTKEKGPRPKYKERKPFGPVVKVTKDRDIYLQRSDVQAVSSGDQPD